MQVHQDITELIGRTPLLALNTYSEKLGTQANIIAKLELLNPTGSVKDRASWAMIHDAEEKGLLTAKSVIIEPTSGNTGIGLAALAAARGYRIILTMPETMSLERRALLKSFGAELVLTEGEKGMAGAIEEALKLAVEVPNSFVPGQFDNPANPEMHYQTTGPEIWHDTGGQVDYFVAGVGTGGTVSGVGRYLKEQNPDVRIVAVEPSDSPVLSQGYKGPHGIQGIGAGFIPDTLDTESYDEVFAVDTDDAYRSAKELQKCEGLLVGISSGAALWAAAEIAKRLQAEVQVEAGDEGESAVGKSAFDKNIASKNIANKNIVVVLPDTGERYLSTPLFND